MTTTYRGSCLCGDVRFSVQGVNPSAANCHCTMCRKFHGAAFGTLVSVSGLRWLAGDSNLKEFVAANGTTRTFCGQCGSSLGFRVRGADATDIELAIATFDDDLPVSVEASIYTHYKANWCDLPAGLPAYGEGRPG